MMNEEWRMRNDLQTLAFASPPDMLGNVPPGVNRFPLC